MNTLNWEMRSDIATKITNEQIHPKPGKDKIINDNNRHKSVNGLVLMH